MKTFLLVMLAIGIFVTCIIFIDIFNTYLLVKFHLSNQNRAYVIGLLTTLIFYGLLKLGCKVEKEITSHFK